MTPTNSPGDQVRRARQSAGAWPGGERQRPRGSWAWVASQAAVLRWGSAGPPGRGARLGGAGAGGGALLRGSGVGRNPRGSGVRPGSAAGGGGRAGRQGGGPVRGGAGSGFRAPSALAPAPRALPLPPSRCRYRGRRRSNFSSARDRRDPGATPGPAPSAETMDALAWLLPPLLLLCAQQHRGTR